jgi:hypothetical protein
VDLQNADLEDAVADVTTWWPQGFDPAAAKVRMVGLEGSDLRGMPLARLDLIGSA